MTTEQAALLGVIAGGLITIFGSLITGLLNMWLQWKQTRWALADESRRKLINKQTDSLQKCVQMIDFLVGAKDTELGSGGIAMWNRIREENLSDGALFPPDLGDDFRTVIRSIVLLDRLDRSSLVLDYPLLERLRAGCVAHLHTS